MTDGTLLTDRARPAVRFERQLPDPPAVVWRALTEREQLDSWFPSDVIVSGGRWEVGAAIASFAEVGRKVSEDEVLSAFMASRGRRGSPTYSW